MSEGKGEEQCIQQPPRWTSLGMSVYAADFERIGREMLGRHHLRREATEDARFRATFGVGAYICAVPWHLLDPYENMPQGVKPQHLLFALLFLKLYLNERTNADICGVDKKTYQKWTWIFVDAISWLEADVVCTFVYISCHLLLSASSSVDCCFFRFSG